MKIIEMNIIKSEVDLSFTCTCDDDCNNCWERCNINSGDCFPDCDNCSDYSCIDNL